MKQEEIEARPERAMELFRMGYNCSQSVVASCADLFGVDKNLALRMSASFGGGIGRMRKTCGAACGMFLLEGLHSGSVVEGDQTGKAANYANVQALAQTFKETYGSITCAELLGLAQVKTDTNPQPEPRTDTYYKKRPCVEMVGNAVKIFLQSIDKNA
jgi:C_GCAxxG_C_C family probable redox protein